MSWSGVFTPTPSLSEILKRDAVEIPILALAELILPVVTTPVDVDELI